MKSLKYKTIWLSDIHLGTSISQAHQLLEFLKSLETKNGHGYAVEKLYLNGDIIDMTNINHKIFWTAHRTVIKKLLRMADKGVQIHYIRGNHDYYLEEIFQHDFDIDFNGISFSEREIHTTVDGKKYLVMHGDQFDGIVKIHPWLYGLGDFLYGILIFINKWQNRIRRLFGGKEWSFSLWLKTKAKNAVKFVSNFEKLIVTEAHKADVEGIICGHLHILKDEMIDEIHYLNSGCWTEFCSCIVEHPDGRLEAIRL